MTQSTAFPMNVEDYDTSNTIYEIFYHYYLWKTVWPTSMIKLNINLKQKNFSKLLWNVRNDLGFELWNLG